MLAGAIHPNDTTQDDDGDTQQRHEDYNPMSDSVSIKRLDHSIVAFTT